MKILLDTHYLLWLSQSPESLTPEEMKLLSSNRNKIFYSPISLWEVAIKYSIGKLNIGKTTPDSLREFIEKQDVDSVGFHNSIVSSSFRLPFKENHRDPFDRMLIWQAIKGEYVLLSRDRKFQQYIEDGLLLRQEKITT